MLAIGVIKRPSFALRAAMAIMPTLTQRSIFYGVRTCSVEAWRDTAQAQLEAVLGNLRPSGRRGCQLIWSCWLAALASPLVFLIRPVRKKSVLRRAALVIVVACYLFTLVTVWSLLVALSGLHG